MTFFKWLEMFPTSWNLTLLVYGKFSFVHTCFFCSVSPTNSLLGTFFFLISDLILILCKTSIHPTSSWILKWLLYNWFRHCLNWMCFLCYSSLCICISLRRIYVGYGWFSLEWFIFQAVVCFEKSLTWTMYIKKFKFSIFNIFLLSWEPNTM